MSNPKKKPGSTRIGFCFSPAFREVLDLASQVYEIPKAGLVRRSLLQFLETQPPNKPMAEALNRYYLERGRR